MIKISFKLAKQDIKELTNILELYLSNKIDFTSKSQFYRYHNLYEYLRGLQYGRNKKKI